MTDDERQIIEAWEADVRRLRDRAAQLRKTGHVQGNGGSRNCAALAQYAERECARLRAELDEPTAA